MAVAAALCVTCGYDFRTGGQAGQKPASAAPAAAAKIEKSQGIVYAVAAVAVLVALGFGYGLWSLMRKEPPAVEPVAAQQPAVPGDAAASDATGAEAGPPASSTAAPVVELAAAPAGELEALEQFTAEKLAADPRVKGIAPRVEDLVQVGGGITHVHLETIESAGPPALRVERRVDSLYDRNRVSMRGKPDIDVAVFIGDGSVGSTHVGRFQGRRDALRFVQEGPRYSGIFAGQGRVGPWGLDYADGKPRMRGRYLGHKRHGKFVSWSEDGRRRWEGLYDKDVLVSSQVVTAEAAFAEALLDAHLLGIIAMAAARNGERVATLGSDETLRIWDVANEQELTTIAYRGEFVELQFTPDIKTLQVYGIQDDNRILRVLDAASGQERLNLRMHQAPLLSPDASRLYSLVSHGVIPGRGDYLRVSAWDLASGEQTFEIDSVSNPGQPALDFTGLAGLALSPDGQLLATAEKRAVRIWKAADGTPVETIPLVDAEGQMILSAERVEFSPDGKTLLIWGLYGSSKRVRLCDLSSRQLRNLEQEVEAGALEPPEFRTPPLFTSDSSLLYAMFGQMGDGARYAPPAVWEVGSGKQRSLKVPDHQVESVIAATPANALVATVDVKGVLRVRDTQTGAERWVSQPGETLDRRAAFTSDGRWLAECHREYRGMETTRHLIRLIDLKQSRVLDLTTTLSPISILAISPDDGMLLAAEQTGQVHVWDLSKAPAAGAPPSLSNILLDEHRLAVARGERDEADEGIQAAVLQVVTHAGGNADRGAAAEVERVPSTGRGGRIDYVQPFLLP